MCIGDMRFYVFPNLYRPKSTILYPVISENLFKNVKSGHGGWKAEGLDLIACKRPRKV